MMNLKEKITALLNYFANKNREFGCYVKTCDNEIHILVDEERADTIKYYEYFEFGVSEDECRDSLRVKEIIGKPVMIGDVLEKVRINCADSMTRPFPPNRDIVLDLWEFFGLTKSLNEILGGEIESAPLLSTLKLNKKDPLESTMIVDKRLKNKDAQSLFNFLWVFFEKEINN